MARKSRRVVTSDDIYNDLLGKIINLEYKPGEGISENELCEKYGTTRHNVRRALAVLKEKRLIEVFPQRGTYVSLIDLKYVDDVLFLRGAVEQEAIHAIFKRDDNSDLIKKLTESVEKQEKLADPEKNPAAFYDLDIEFHNILLSAVGREKVKLIFADAYLHVRRWRNMEVEALKRIENLPVEHRKIIKAIEENNEYNARIQVSRHMNSVGQFGEELKKQYPQYFKEG